MIICLNFQGSSVDCCKKSRVCRVCVGGRSYSIAEWFTSVLTDSLSILEAQLC